MSTDVFDLYVQQSLTKLESLWRRNENMPRAENETSNQRQILLEESLSELSASIDELQLACETLKQQNDILLTERQQLIQESNCYQQLFDTAPEGYLITTRDGTIRQVNQIASELLGVEKKFLFRKSLAAFISVDYRQIYYSQLNKIKQGEKDKAVCKLEITNRQQHSFMVRLTIDTVEYFDVRDLNLRWQIEVLPAKYNSDNSEAENLATLNLNIVHRLRSSAYNLTTLIEEERLKNQNIYSVETTTSLPNNLVALVSQLQNLANDGYILNWINQLSDLKLSLIDYSIFIPSLIRQISCSQGGLPLSMIVNTPDLYITGINDVLLLKQIIYNILSLINHHFGNARGEIDIFKMQEDTLRLLIKYSIDDVNRQVNLEEMLISPQRSDDSWLVNNNVQVSTIAKSIALLKGKLNFSYPEPNLLHITLELPIVVSRS